MPRLTSLVPFWRRKSLIAESERDDGLPIELWSIIIDFILDEMRHPYWYCRPGDFPEYKARFNAADTLKGGLELEDWKIIRLVCRTWKQLAGPQTLLHLTDTPRDISTRHDVFKGAIRILSHGRTTERCMLRNVARDITISPNLTTIILGEYRNWESVEVLLDNPSSFPNLRCLSLLSTRCRRPFWKCIEDGYPQLVSLTIRYFVDGITGDYTLKNLEILDTTFWRGFRLSCPSLKHCSIRYGCTDSVMEFFVEHGHQLESIIFEDYVDLDGMTRPDRIWSIFPNIQTIGKRADGNILSPPPIHHPLRHIQLFSYRKILSINAILTELNSLPAITSIHIWPTELHDITLEDVKSRCRGRNIEVVEVLKMEPDLVSNASIVAFIRRCWIPALVDCILRLKQS
ncbi:hypothetical protein FRC14_008188 [Serendipita sp. 396]|nr:hypothetical protein FRC14_008188 [Serendipita sp. 396]KAG8776358.1 hypothetical protein FRC15_011982 [Serendipita sp. 397]KAG8793294.1 hypothetical protein FRC16_011015 [Serendipita sp. 398]KAG8819080.1 hypothetical protein FRC19_010133 [Serendipita sp. 401]KAG8829229.1 hypothetical protein FRC18_009450 [Serendipita sp. 400]KAG8859252.1 hypothetical protein FRC20_011839 [Serendipita sp. 405]